MTSSLSSLPKVIINNCSRPHQHKNKRTDIAVVCDLFLTWKRKYFITGGNAYLLFFWFVWHYIVGSIMRHLLGLLHLEQAWTWMTNISKHMSQSNWAKGLNLLPPDLVWWTPGHTPLEVCPGFLLQPKQDLFLHVCSVNPVCCWAEVLVSDNVPMYSGSLTSSAKSASYLYVYVMLFKNCDELR